MIFVLLIAREVLYRDESSGIAALVPHAAAREEGCAEVVLSTPPDFFTWHSGRFACYSRA